MKINFTRVILHYWEVLSLSVKGLVTLAKELLTENPGFYLLSGKLSQDPLEQYFSTQWRRCGDNTILTVEEFGYNKLALHTIKSKNVKSLRGNCRLHDNKQVNFMKENCVPLKRRKRAKWRV